MKSGSLWTNPYFMACHIRVLITAHLEYLFVDFFQATTVPKVFGKMSFPIGFLVAGLFWEWVPWYKHGWLENGPYWRCISKNVTFRPTMLVYQRLNQHEWNNFVKLLRTIKQGNPHIILTLQLFWRCCLKWSFFFSRNTKSLGFSMDYFIALNRL